MKCTLGILAHVDAGKTTFAESVLYYSNAIRKKGRVDEKTAFLDYNEIERERGITVFSDTARIEFCGNVCTLVDTPGHVDFSLETESAVSVMDYAVLIVSAVEGVQSHTETLWGLLREYKVPTFVFINKTDLETADSEKTLRELRERLSGDVVDFSGDFSEELAERSEKLFEEYLKTQKISDTEEIKNMIADCRVFPCFFGSALKGEGIEAFLSAFFAYAKEKEAASDAFSAVCYKVRSDGVRRAYLKILSGKIYAKDTLITENGEEKINEIRFYDGERYEQKPFAEKGDICAVTGVSGISVGDITDGREISRGKLLTEPLFSAKVIHDASIAAHTMLEYFKTLEDENPWLHVSWDGHLKEIHIRIMGKIQLEILQYEVKKRFGADISFGPCKILYKETVRSPIVGYGHYEPLRHYAEVHIRISPLPKGSGIRFVSECKTDVLSQSFQNLVRTHVFEKEHKGVLCGFPICDVEFALVVAAAHEKHTTGGDFREATYRAIRHGLMRAESVLLEPMYKFRIRTSRENLGKIISDIIKLGATADEPTISGEIAEISGRGAAAKLSEYSEELMTRGIVMISSFDGYDEAENAEQIISEIGYDPEHDTENSADSIFCTKGAGYHVKWNEVENHIHLK